MTRDDPAASRHHETQKLMESCQGLVRSLAWKIHQKIGHRVEMDDLIGYGQIGLAEAARDFDTSRHVQFTTYAYYRVRGAILNGLDTMAWFKRHQYHANRYENHAQEVFSLEAGQDSLEHETPDSDTRWLVGTGTTLAMISMMSDWQAPLDETLADPVGPGPEEHLIFNEMKARLHQLVAALPGDAGELIRRMYFENQSLTQASQDMGISKAWGSRLHARTLQRLGCSLRLLGQAE